jgi:hypothetical protein
MATQEHQEWMELKDLLGRKEFRGKLDLSDLKVSRDLLVMTEFKASPESKEFRERLDLREIRVNKVLREIRENRDLRVLTDLPGLQVMMVPLGLRVPPEQLYLLSLIKYLIIYYPVHIFV